MAGPVSVKYAGELTCSPGSSSQLLTFLTINPDECAGVQPLRAEIEYESPASYFLRLTYGRDDRYEALRLPDRVLQKSSKGLRVLHPDSTLLDLSYGFALPTAEGIGSAWFRPAIADAAKTYEAPQGAYVAFAPMAGTDAFGSFTAPYAFRSVMHGQTWFEVLGDRIVDGLPKEMIFREFQPIPKELGGPPANPQPTIRIVWTQTSRSDRPQIPSEREFVGSIRDASVVKNGVGYGVAYEPGMKVWDHYNVQEKRWKSLEVAENTELTTSPMFAIAAGSIAILIVGLALFVGVKRLRR